MTPRVSIGIPAYRRPDTLVQAIASVLEQSVADVEVLVGDDSGDLEQVVRGVGDDRVVYRRNEPRLGMAANWNALLDAASAPFVGLLMDDDRLLPGFLEQVLAELEADPSVGVVFTDHYFDRRGVLDRRSCALPGGRYDDFLALHIEQLPVPVSAALMRREAWADARPLPDLLTADVVLYARAAAAGWPFVYVDEPLMVYRVHGSQQSGDVGFRDHVVRAWEVVPATDPRTEALRRARLGSALVTRAAGRLRAGLVDEARTDLARARECGVVDRRMRALEALAARPYLVRAAWWLWRRGLRFG